jgi:hypothetical protein
MKRRDAVPNVSEIPPFIDQWGKPTFESPWGQNRPNPALKDALAQYERDAKNDEHTYTRRTVEQINERRVRIHRRLQRTAAAVTVIGSTVFGVTAASAYFDAAGTGSGTGRTGTLQAVTATGAVVSNLIPDGTAHDVTLTVTNPNSFAVALKSVTGNGAITPDTPAHSGCSPTGVAFTDQTGLSQSIPGGSVPTPVTLTGAATMDNTSASACQGATFTIPVTISVQQP